VSKGNGEVVLFDCLSCGAVNEEIKISPKDRKWNCRCGATLVLVQKNKTSEKSGKLFRKHERKIAQIKEGFQIYSTRGKRISSENMTILVLFPKEEMS
jgi:hypothetical protein